MKGDMLKKIVAISLVGLFLVTSFVVAENSIGSYERNADVNRDGIVDILDLVEVGKAYGSNLTLCSEPNKTVVTVLSFDKEPPEVENARVAIIDPETYGDAVNVAYTNSSGIATFELGSNKNYTAIAWSGSAYNYANFTTNMLGEASPLIILEEPSLPTSELPKGWIVVSLLDNETGLVHSGLFRIYLASLEYVRFEGWHQEQLWVRLSESSVHVVPPDPLVNKPNSGRGVFLIDPDGNVRGSCTFSPDENGCASVVVYVTPP